MAINPAIFRAYDVRGKYPEDVNEDAVREIARFLGGYFMQQRGERKPVIFVGHDARLSSPELYTAVLSALKKSDPKPKIKAVGLISTPMLYFLVHKYKAAGGIVITASHNPKEYNGMKMVGAEGVLSGKEVQTLMSKSQ